VVKLYRLCTRKDCEEYQRALGFAEVLLIGEGTLGSVCIDILLDSVIWANGGGALAQKWMSKLKKDSSNADVQGY
jgi:hypothetical protein